MMSHSGMKTTANRHATLLLWTLAARLATAAPALPTVPAGASWALLAWGYANGGNDTVTNNTLVVDVDLFDQAAMIPALKAAGHIVIVSRRSVVVGGPALAWRVCDPPAALRCNALHVPLRRTERSDRVALLPMLTYGISPPGTSTNGSVTLAQAPGNHGVRDALR